MYPYDSDPSYEVFTKELAANEADDPKELPKKLMEELPEELPEDSLDEPVLAQDHRRGRDSRHGGRHGERGHRHDDRGHGRDHGHRRPPGAPPTFIPSESGMLRAVDPRAISHCLNSFTYIWLTLGNGFWMYPTFVGPRSVAGYRWGRFGWSFTGFDIRAIKSFTCR